ncbi:Uncharacterised protein [uncultured archaeon]|nr:Uncharacterised protein [uncultured archaeon]
MNETPNKTGIKKSRSTKNSDGFGRILWRNAFDFVLLTFLLACLFCVLAMLVSHLAVGQGGFLGSAAAVVYRVVALSYACHQMPERSFLFGGIPLAMCSRDAGIYLGCCVGLIWGLFSGRKYGIFFLLAGMVPLIIDVLGQGLFLWESLNAVRFATGLVLGVSWSAWVMGRLFGIRPHFRGLLSDRRTVFFSVACALFVVFLVFQVSVLFAG